MNRTTQRTLSILQRVPAILAVTAASYGLAQPQQKTGAPLPSAQGQHSAGPAQPVQAALRR